MSNVTVKISGRDLVRGALPVRDTQGIRDVMLSHAFKARHDIFEFFEFVMRDLGGAGTNKIIGKLAPHQKLALEFMMAHDRSVNIFPIGFSKTWLSVGITLYLMGQNPGVRGAVISASQTIAAKTLGMVREYIETSEQLKMVFPHLRPHHAQGEAWTQNELTIERPIGLKDPTLVAAGFGSKQIQGSRLSWVVVDDYLDEENTSSEEQRIKAAQWLDSTVFNRLDPIGGKVIVINTPWHPEDVVGLLSSPPPLGAGWATMRMDAYGDIEIYDDILTEHAVAEGRGEFWQSDLIRPTSSDPLDARCRLVDHDPDPGNEQTLWPERFPLREMERLRLRLVHNPRQFARQYKCVTRNDATSYCKQEFVDRCYANGRDRGLVSFAHEYLGSNLTFTGVDLAFSKKKGSDDTAFFTFEVLPSGMRVLLDVDCGKWDGPTIVKKLIDKQRRYKSTVRVESNAAQVLVKQFALQHDLSIPVKTHQTTRKDKVDPLLGVQSLFLEMANGAWAWPTGGSKGPPPMMVRFANACLNYVPEKHVADELMACLPPGELVTTERGLVPIEAVVTGDRVLTHLGRFRRVTGTTQHEYDDDLIVFRPAGGIALRATKNHPVWKSAARIETETRKNRVVPSEWSFERADTLRAGGMKRGDFVEYPKHPLGDENMDSDKALILGLWLAEGSASHRQVTFALHQREKHLVKFLKVTMWKVFRSRGSVVKTPGSKGIRLIFGSREAGEFFSMFGKQESKHVPWDLWSSMDADSRLRVARGWLMGDGFYYASKGAGHLHGTSIARGILEQVLDAFRHAEMLPSIGVFMKAGNRMWNGKPSTNRDSWKIGLSQMDTRALLKLASEPVEQAHWWSAMGGTEDTREGFQDRTSSMRQHLPSGGIGAKLNHIHREHYYGLVYNLHVEEDESYCANGIAVHNSHFAREQAREWLGNRGKPPDGNASRNFAANVMRR